MNQLDLEFHNVLSIVVDCCSTEYAIGKQTITTEDLLSKSKKENSAKEAPTNTQKRATNLPFADCKTMTTSNG